jgi:beta-galactosidase
VSRGPISVDRRGFLIGTASAAGLTMVPTFTALAAQAGAGASVARDIVFDHDWRFHRGEGKGFEKPELDDATWRKVDLPHDWSIEDLPAQADPERIRGPFDRDAEGATATGYTVGGEGWYRKRFQLTRPAVGRVEILFQGVYLDSDVWLNGRLLGTHVNGYTAFAYDLTPHLSASGDNVLAVRVRNAGRNSRWYSGSGIYRHVRLDVLPEQARIARWGVGIFTRRLSKAEAVVQIDTRLEDIGDGLQVAWQVKNEAGRVVAKGGRPAAAQLQHELRIARPQWWSPERPALYTLETELRRGSMVLDRVQTRFGTRIVSFDASQGMQLNGKPVKMRGGCIHHDHGLLGAAAFDAAEDRKVRLLKARGFNAVRPSHNPFSPAFIEACDRHGLLVVAETFDVWRKGKEPGDYAVHFDQHWRQDLATMVLSARHHPSIVLWSIGNEIQEREIPENVELQWHLANEVHRLDPTRPVTAAINFRSGWPVSPSEKAARAGHAGVADAAGTLFLDVVGYNYKLADLEPDHARYPQRVFFGSESQPRDVRAFWDLTERSPWLVGDFVWTAMDYLGETGIGGSVVAAPEEAKRLGAEFGSKWPWVNAFCGDLDLIGQQKPQSRARDVIWGLSPLEIAVQRPVPEGQIEVPRQWGWSDEQPSWTWPGAEGRTLAVRVYTAGDRVELHLNGRKLDDKTLTPADLKLVEFAVPYQPGVLEAVAYRGQTRIASRKLTTAGVAAAIRLVPEQRKGSARRGALAYVMAEIVDAQSRVLLDASTSIQLDVGGPAQLIAFGSANPHAVGSYQSPRTRTWSGRALAILRGTGTSGRVELRAHGEGLAAGSAVLQFL